VPDSLLPKCVIETDKPALLSAVSDSLTSSLGQTSSFKANKTAFLVQ
jgi:hypothetical protein